jgi:hypothetical protein
MEQNYKIGQVITLNNGYTGEVISIGTFGNKDIRPPYHKIGQPTLKGINGYLGYIRIIPNEWEVLYGDEVKENEIIDK